MDHSFGTLPLFEVLKCLRRMQERPFLIGAMVRFYGFLTLMFKCSAPGPRRCCRLHSP